jgi:hypothetical protein
MRAHSQAPAIHLTAASLLLFAGCELPELTTGTPPTSATMAQALRGAALESRFPAVGALLLPELDAEPGEEPNLCTATLIDRLHIAGAAHCFIDWIKSPVFVIGPDPKATDARRVELAYVIHDDNFDQHRVGLKLSDFAMARLREPIDDVPPIPLFLAPDSGWFDALAVGYGKPSDDGDEKVRRSAPIFAVADPKWLLAYAGEVGTCEGDSGGPLLTFDAGGRPRSIGLLSWVTHQNRVRPCSAAGVSEQRWLSTRFFLDSVVDYRAELAERVPDGAYLLASATFVVVSHMEPELAKIPLPRRARRVWVDLLNGTDLQLAVSVSRPLQTKTAKGDADEFENADCMGEAYAYEQRCSLRARKKKAVWVQVGRRNLKIRRRTVQVRVLVLP